MLVLGSNHWQRSCVLHKNVKRWRRWGRAADVIGSLAEEQQAQVIVMGLSSAQGAFAPRTGSIAYRVLTSTTVPVLVVPAQAAEGVHE
jgi:hypothetical protein